MTRLHRAALLSLSLVLAGAAPLALAETCARPGKVKIPDPAKADAKDFDKAHKDVLALHAATSAFLACLEKESAEAKADYDTARQDYDKAVKAYNASVEKANKGQ